MRAAPGRSSRKSPSCFAPSSAEMKLTPVTLPPGRLRLATRPSPTGSPPVIKTIGTVVVAALAARAAGTLPTIRATCRRRRSATSAGNRSGWFSVRAVLDRDVLALDVPFFLQALAERNHARYPNSDGEHGETPWPATVASCARAASGHASAAPPKG